jgi:hypothetical protein
MYGLSGGNVVGVRNLKLEAPNRQIEGGQDDYRMLISKTTLNKSMAGGIDNWRYEHGDAELSEHRLACTCVIKPFLV